jgi:hypothetical protein
MPRRKSPLLGMQGFWHLLREVRHLLTWGVGSATVPIAIGFTSFYPPWPPAIVQLTALLQVVALVLTYHTFRQASAKVLNRLLATSAAVLCIGSLLYLVGLSQFTFTEPLSKLRFVKGFICTSDAFTVYHDMCPWLGDDQLRQAEWEAPRLWTLWSVTVVRVALVLLWLVSFVALSTLLGSFVVHQSAVKATR